MRIIPASSITDALETLCVQACCDLPQDVVAAIRAAAAQEQGAARAVLEQLLENQDIAREINRPCCQDTGMAVVFLDIGHEVYIDGDVNAAVNEGVKKAYCGGYLRKSVLTPLTRVNTNDNTPAVLHVRFTEGDKVRVTVAPKGFGSENMSRLWMLKPAQGEKGAIEAIVETVRLAGANPCPPVVVGVGIGGTAESAMLLAKRQLLRSPLGAPSGEPLLAAMEKEALEKINALHIGPMGLGGNTTALAVHIGATYTHLAGLPVAVNMQCHACRHAEVLL